MNSDAGELVGPRFSSVGHPIFSGRLASYFSGTGLA
jgi:hypothetical protein